MRIVSTFFPLLFVSFLLGIPNVSFADGEPKFRKVGDLKPTFYWVALEQDDGATRDKELKDMEGNVLARVSDKFFRSIRLEGTGRLLDGRVLNYAGRIGSDIRYLVCPPEAPYGYGVNLIPLVPFRSVAVDPSVVPIGSRVYIPQVIGAELPNGEIHDGYFMAVDIGDAIKNKRIDMFTSFGDQSAVFRRAGLDNMKPTAVYIVE
ncbi:MAG: 3D domain-containing protein [Oligoflexia bacterium]|nr:3D domain-containing protein [Oligoflexia bacterium]